MSKMSDDPAVQTCEADAEDGRILSSRDLHLAFLSARVETSSYRYIITEDQIRQILTPRRIRDLLVFELDIETSLALQYVNTVNLRASKVLAILICIGQVQALLDHFVYPEVWDDRLPLSRAELCTAFSAEFVSEQQNFLAPVFQTGLFKDWKPEVILPFSVDEPITDGEGSFASVHKIKIIPAFQKLVPIEPPGNEVRVPFSILFQSH